MTTKQTDTTRYFEVCKDLGIRADVHFVELLPGGAIDFTSGKPDEIRALARTAALKGYKLSKALRAAIA